MKAVNNLTSQTVSATVVESGQSRHHQLHMGQLTLMAPVLGGCYVHLEPSAPPRRTLLSHSGPFM